MATISQDQAMSYAYDAGFRGDAQKIIVAIAQAESGLRTDAQNCFTLFNFGVGPRVCDRGILQFNSYWHSEVNDACANNPACAFKEAYRVSSSGRVFSQWTTYNNLSFQKFLSGTTLQNQQTPLQKADIPVVTGAVNAVDAIGSLNQAFTTLTKPDTWIRVGLFAFAIVLLIVGMMVLGLGGNNVQPTR